MAQVTKAVLAQQNADLRMENAMLREHLLGLQHQQHQTQPTTRVPSAAPVGRVAISVDNPLFTHLPHHTPHRKMQCGVHGVVTANKIGVCVLCACEIARGGRAAA
jgi:hypothetical protein